MAIKLKITLIFTFILLSFDSHAQEPFRGKLLYQNHCLNCHESIIHIREKNTVRTQQDLIAQVTRWANEQKLGWQNKEIKDVTRYLNITYYRFGENEGENTMPLTLISSAFKHNGDIPALYTCDGNDRSPALSWSNIPDGTKSLALIIDDPDAPDPAAPKMTWVHWVLYNIPATTTTLTEAVPSTELPSGTLPGLNDWKKTNYGGPCPPIGRHRYFHKLYALDVVLPDLKKPTKQRLEKAMQGHIIEKAELIGTYKR